MKRLYISAWIATAIAIVGFILMTFNMPGGVFIFMFGTIAASIFCLVNAFWLISKRHLSSGACMYCILLLDLFMMFRLLPSQSNELIPLYLSGIGFLVLAVLAKVISIYKAKNQSAEVRKFDTPMYYALATTLLAIVVLAK